MESRFLSAAVKKRLCGAVVLCAFAALADEPFMTIRLWPQHHDDPVLFKQTLAALTKFRAACDEVWFCTEDGFPPLVVHEASAQRMAGAADACRKAGIVPSLQIGMTIGHCDNFSPKDCSLLTWGTMVAEDGAVVSLQTTNARGGRVALFGAAGPDSFVSVLSTSRRRQLLDAFDWVSGGKLPVLAETACRAFVIPRVTES